VPKSGLGKAIGYTLDQRSAVTRFVEDGCLAIDNNIAEREIKAVVIGRKNWLFADSMDGMRTNATMYSLVQTAKANGINPFDYLRYLFVTIPRLENSSQIECLLPWNMPRSCGTIRYLLDDRTVHLPLLCISARAFCSFNDQV
jgi:hypothetical protein